MPFLDFTAGQTLTAAQVDDYLMRQAVMVFDSSAARSSAIGTAVAEGMITYLKDTDAVEKYNGSAWEAIVAGDITAVTAGTGLAGGGTSGSVTLNVSNVPAAEILTSVSTISLSATAYTAVAGDANNLIYSFSSAAHTVTIPDVLTVGDRIDIWRDGGGTTTIAAGTGVSSWRGAGTAGTAVTFKIDQQYNAATVIKVANGTYGVVGKITV